MQTNRHQVITQLPTCPFAKTDPWLSSHCKSPWKNPRRCSQWEDKDAHVQGAAPAGSSQSIPPIC